MFQNFTAAANTSAVKCKSQLIWTFFWLVCANNTIWYRAVNQYRFTQNPLFLGRFVSKPLLSPTCMLIWCFFDRKLVPSHQLPPVSVTQKGYHTWSSWLYNFHWNVPSSFLGSPTSSEVSESPSFCPPPTSSSRKLSPGSGTSDQ